MSEPPEDALATLAECTVALPETRQLDVLAGLLARRGARVLRCPLIAILDTPDGSGVNAWLQRFVRQPADDLILLTGEGLRRLCGFAERARMHPPFIAALARARKIARGPKPGRALREVGLGADLLAETPTTEGVIATLDSLPMEGRRVALQLYGEEPNLRLVDYLRGRGIEPDCVAPYIYAPNEDDQRVLELIEQLAAGEVDVIAFTSMPQYRRMEALAHREGLADKLSQGIRQICVAAVGPVVAKDLRERGVRVDVMPQSSWFMKPLVTEIERIMQR